MASRSVALTRLGLLLMFICGLGLVASDGSATPPGSNGPVVFQKQSDGWTQLFTMTPDGKHLRRVTRGRHLSTNAVWSPDGKLIAFGRLYRTHADVMVMRADGSGLRSLTPEGLQDEPAFTPDGRSIVYVRTLPTESSLWLMDTEGRQRRRLTHGASDETPVVSPDGTRVAFARERSQTRSALFVIGLDGRGIRRLTPWKLAAVGKLDWAPDGSRILFHTNDQKSQVYTIRPDSSGLTRLTTGSRNYCSSSFSPDGRQILLIDNCSSDTDTNLYAMSAAGGKLRLVPHGHGAHRASWGTPPTP